MVRAGLGHRVLASYVFTLVTPQHNEKICMIEYSLGTDAYETIGPVAECKYGLKESLIKMHLGGSVDATETKWTKCYPQIKDTPVSSAAGHAEPSLRGHPTPCSFRHQLRNIVARGRSKAAQCTRPSADRPRRRSLRDWIQLDGHY